MSLINPHQAKRYRAGFTLVEILVTIVVVSIGLLGLAGLQINGLRANLSSEARSKASVLANDIIERMRANPLGVAAGAYDGVSYTEADCAGAPPAPFCSSTSGGSGPVDSCNAAEMAAVDAWVWGCGMPVAADVEASGIVHQLTNGTASITCAAPCGAGSAHTITVTWDERSPNASASTTAGESTTQTLTLTVVP
ncbi:MAG TPA: type IV pilus modification protein PilV [Gammaproteobacteria bacterium]|nr:type IV pilus modification protein PilV [Gammaproteobacteria bacterium]